MDKKTTALAFVILLLFFLQTISLLHYHSLTNDEPAHTTSGLLYWQTGKFAGGVSNPPLLQLSFGLPYALSLADYSLYSNAPPISGRYVNLLFSFFLLITLVSFAYQRYGPQGALLASFLYVTSPSLIAHSTITTTDIGVTLFSLCTFFAMSWWQKQTSPWAIVLPATFMALAMASKFTSLVFFPLLLLLIISSHWTKSHRITHIFQEILILSLVVWFIFSASYSFHGVFEGKRINSGIGRALTFPLPTEAVKGLTNKLRLSEQFWPLAFYLAWEGDYARWLYYPTIIFVKEPLGTIFVLLFFFGAVLLRKIRPSRNDLYIWLPAISYFLALYMNKFHDGFRHLFPCFVFLIIAAAAIVELAKSSKYIQYFLVFCIILNCLSIGITHPFQMSYFNALGEAVAKEPFMASGADTDYGQDDGALERELRNYKGKSAIYINPQPAEQPRAGLIAINCDTYEKQMNEGVNDYLWLFSFPLKKRVGGAWLIFEIKESNYQNLPWPKGKIWLDYLLYNRQYDRLNNEVKKLIKIHPEVLLYELKSLIYSGQYERAIKAFERYAKQGTPYAQRDKRWYFLTLELAGRGRGKKLVQLCRALLSLRELDEVASRHLRQKIILSHQLSSLKRPYPNREVTLWKGLYLFDEAKFKEALPWLMSLGKDSQLTKELAEKRSLCRLAVHTLKDCRKSQRLRLVFDRRFAAHAPQLCAQIVNELQKEEPDNYSVVMASQWLWGWQRRGKLTVNLGRGSIFDKIDLRSQQLLLATP